MYSFSNYNVSTVDYINYTCNQTYEYDCDRHGFNSSGWRTCTGTKTYTVDRETWLNSHPGHCYELTCDIFDWSKHLDEIPTKCDLTCDLSDWFLYFKKSELQCDLTCDRHDWILHLSEIEIQCDLTCDKNTNPYAIHRNLKKLTIDVLKQYCVSLELVEKYVKSKDKLEWYYAAIDKRSPKWYWQKNLVEYPNKKTTWINIINNHFRPQAERFGEPIDRYI